MPANQDQVRLTLTAPPQSADSPINLTVEGFARIQDQPVIHPAVPAENMMQAFAYWHLVPAKDLEVSLSNRGQFRVQLKLIDPASVRIPAGGSAGVKVRTPGVQFTNNFQLELSDPPDGISIQTISAIGTETEITLHSDAKKIKLGVKGNLIVNVLAKRPQQPPVRAPRPVATSPHRPSASSPPSPSKSSPLDRNHADGLGSAGVLARRLRRLAEGIRKAEASHR